ncbi:uncharacterized protein LOC128193952 [Vigna angularis]|uniref:uncharacterized protein LOC128193952 n=1 Tax=Phaseolus angularis TaxID=3914 RepID=UPI0022B590BA|nr:uncharacterized protein LOC128193952 [Vigna angularis]
MDQVPPNRSWMYDRCYRGRGALKESFVLGVEEFIIKACEQDRYQRDGGLRCPCSKCDCTKILNERVVKVHLYKNGFKPNYFIWEDHGETMQEADLDNDVTFRGVETEGEPNEQVITMEDMVHDALIQRQPFQASNSSNIEEAPNEETQRFYNLLLEANTPLYEGASDSKLSMCVRLLACKSNWNIPNQCIDFFAKMLLDVTPHKCGLPKTYYDAKKIVSKLGLQSQRIDCCVDGCMLFYDNEYGKMDGALVECKFCGKPRYQQHKTGASSKKKVPVKSMFYLPIIPRLQRMYASKETATEMTWHHHNKSSNGVLRHPCDGEAWRHFDRVHRDFSIEPRNVRLGLCSDGFNPYVQASSIPYSCWPVIVTPYNLPPEMCMSKPYMFLTCLIPGPFNPKVRIDVYLEPLIDDLKKLWSGVITYDISRRQNFIMRAMLMWTINDFPAYGMLSGWSTHGKLACPHCMEHSKAFRLYNGRKNSWFDSHRRFLPNDHAFRRNKNAFKKGEVDMEDVPPYLTGTEVWNRVNGYPKVTENGAPRIDGYGEWHNWTKKNIFWDLPYWKDNLLRHNLDFMHIEKNFFDNIFNTVMNVSGKSKDNEKARMDLGLYCKRKDLELKTHTNGKMYKPKANYTLSVDQSKQVCQWLKDLRMPDGYSSNLSRCVDVNRGKVIGMKSHDCHVFMECLLPIAFSSLPTHVLNPITEVSHFFRDLCCTTLNEVDLRKMEENIPIIICKMERIFPPSFFDCMEHLPVHLPYEARLGGPVQYRWMYPFERFMGYAKRSIKNKARVEGSIVASYLHKETTHFCSHYFKNFMLTPQSMRNEVDTEVERTTLSVFDEGGRHSGRESTHWLSDEELRSAHVHNDPLSVKNQHLRDLSLGPLRCVKEWHTYFVNGYKFHTHAWSQGKKTINSGVHVKGLTEGGEDDFYGVIKHIYELEYNTSTIEKKVVLFYCDWFDPSRIGTRVDSKYGTVDIRMDKRYILFDPFIIAHNVEQVYYVPYPASRTDKRGWCVAIKTKPRGRIDSNEVDAIKPYQVEEMSHVNDIIQVEEVIRLQDIEAGLEEVDPNNVPSVQRYMDEETSESEEECSEEGQSEDEDEDSFHSSSSE